jgi:hypothetical protein
MVNYVGAARPRERGMVVRTPRVQAMIVTDAEAHATVVRTLRVRGMIVEAPRCAR